MSDYLIQLRPEPDSVPPEVRLRQALKLLLRGFGLRCVSVAEDVKPKVANREPQATPPPAEQGLIS